MSAPDSLPLDAKALRALLLAERTRHAEELAAARGEMQRAQGEVARLMAIIKELQRHRFGRRSERIDPEQLALALEDLEQAIAAAQAAAEKSDETPSRPATTRKRNINRGALPLHLPREEIVIDVADKTCSCCGGLKHRLGEDVSERLDVIPAQLKVLVTRRPKYACAACAGEVVQAPAPERLIENGIPTEALVAHVLVAKYADHTPLYRQAQIYARQGITLDRSTLADWVGRAAFALRPVHTRLLELLKQSTKLFADETTAPVLDPGRGQTKKGQLWAYARDERPWNGADPPGVAYVYAPDRKHARPAEHLAGFHGTLQVDGYGAYAELAESGDVTLAFTCVDDSTRSRLLRRRPSPPRRSCASPHSMPSKPTFAAAPPRPANMHTSSAASRSSTQCVRGSRPSSPPSPASRRSRRRSAMRSHAGKG
jgi:transposase